jgi:hypothetical protein
VASTPYVWNQTYTYSYGNVSYQYTYNYNYQYVYFTADYSQPLQTNNTRRALDSGGYPYSSVIPDKYGISYPWYSYYGNNSFGTPHSMSIMPAAFCDGSVRNIVYQYMPQALLTYDDGQNIPSYYQN